jgi:hypothetical protein
MRAVVMIVADVVSEQTLQMAFVNGDVGLLPKRVLAFEINIQYTRNPARCQRTTISGVTLMRESFQADQNRRATTQKSLSKRPTLGRECRRYSTASC